MLNQKRKLKETNFITNNTQDNNLPNISQSCIQFEHHNKNKSYKTKKAKCHLCDIRYLRENMITCPLENKHCFCRDCVNTSYVSFIINANRTLIIEKIISVISRTRIIKRSCKL